MKNISKLLILVLCFCLLATPVLGASDSVQATLNYRDINISVDGKLINPTDVTGKTVDPFIIDGTTYVPIRAISEAFGCNVEWDDSTNTVKASYAAPAETDSILMAGAGMGKMVFPQEYFEIVAADGTITYEDGFGGSVHTFDGAKGEITDDLYTRVLLLEDEVRVAIVSLEIAQAPEDQVAYTKQIVGEICGVAPENVWVHSTHQFGFMHRPTDTAKAAVYDEQMKAAATEAATEALASFQPAVVGVGTGTCNVSANKNITRPDGVAGGPFYGPGSTLDTNETMSVLRFESLSGENIGFFLSYGTKPSALCTTGKKVGNRQVNTEVTGHASKLMEEEYGVPCMFCMPAAGDQYPRETAMYYGFDADGEWKVIDIGFDEGIKIVDRLGQEMGNDAISIAKTIDCTVSDADISIAATSFNYPNTAGDIEVSVAVDAIAIGDIALVGFKQEMDCATGEQIVEASPYDTTLLVSFLNGDGKYMPHKEAYNFNNGIGTWETARSAFAVGAAEKFVEVATGVLNNLKSDLPAVGKTGAESATLYYRDIKLEINGTLITPTDVNGKTVEPFIIDGTTYVPIRAISEAFGCDVQWADSTSTVMITSREEGLIYKFMTDVTYTDIITDAAQDKYFKEGSALEGVEAILDAGRYYVNGFQVPSTEAACGDAFVIMGYDKLYKSGDGWAAENNKRTGTTFEDARLGMVEALSRTSGLPVYLYDTDNDGYADMVNSSFYAVVLVDSMIDNGDGTISVDRGDFTLTKTKLDVNDIKFLKANVDTAIEEGDFAMFWEDAEDGWMLEREFSINGKLTAAADHQYYVFNDEKIMDGMNNPKASINTANRPGQFANAHLAFELGDVEATFWVTNEGHVASGFTSGDNAAEALTRAIAYCEDLKADVTVSADGAGLTSGAKWVTAEDLATYDTAITAAKAALADSTTKNSALDTQVYNLFVATWGSAAKIEMINAGTIPGGFLAAVKDVA